MRPLRPHQELGLTSVRLSLATGHRRPILMLPTGGGKTLLAAHIVQRALDKGNRVTFCVPTISLIDQTVKAFWDEGIQNVGVIQADHPMTNSWRPVQVASVQTLARRDLPTTDLVIVDEAHLVHKSILGWMAAEPDLKFIGLSATPWTKGLGKHYDDLIIAARIGDLIEAGYLSEFRVFAPSHPDLSGVTSVAGDYHEGQLADAMSKPELTADVVKTWLELGENRPTLCFGVNRAHARQLQHDFEAAGVSTAYVDAFTDRDERESIRKAFHDGDVRVVCNIGTLTTGVDWDVRCLILARPTKSEALYQQIVGRALRTAEGKQDALILDHSDTTLSLGFVTDIHHDALDIGRRKEASGSTRKEVVRVPKECPKCAFVKPIGVHKCSHCGFAPERKAEVEVATGALQQLGGKKAQVDMATKQIWLSGLLWIARDRHYKPGWAARKFKDKFGVWPAHSLAEVAKPAPTAVLNWVKSEQIRYAQGQKKARENAA
jgi:DNA repair protein RadD